MPRPLTAIRRIPLIALLVSLAGCGAPEDRFVRDAALRAGLSDAASEAIDAALVELFGTPAAPKLPPEVEFLDLAALEQAAGPVISHTPGVTQGLYGRHCARCHGVSGDGLGPAAYYQHPYPRDFRRGVYKWKSTRRDAPPSAADLDAVLERGVPGTGMPSFRLLSKKEREILRQYVVYLSIRGQVERELVQSEAETDVTSLAREQLGAIAESWATAEDAVVDLGDAEPAADSVAQGRELFHTRRAACSKCHGEAGQGVATQEVDYDVWNRARLDAKSAGLVSLPVKTARAPTLVGLTPRGGATRHDVLRRIHQGVAGTPMLPAGPKASGEHAVLSDEEIAAVTDYVLTLLGGRSEG